MDAMDEMERLLQRPRHVSASAVARKLASWVEETDDELMGLGAQPLPRGSFHVLCNTICGAETLGEAIADARYLYHLQTRVFELRLHPGACRARLEVRCADGSPSLRLFLAKVSEGLLAWAVGRDLPVEIAVVSSGICLTFPKVLLDLPILRNRKHSVRSSNVVVPLILADRPTGKSLERRVRCHLRRHIARSNMLQDVANDFQISARALRDQLAAEGAPEFREIKDQVRRQVSLVMISDDQLPLDSLARAVGFSELSTFHRAFRRWTGMTPGDFRQDAK